MRAALVYESSLCTPERVMHTSVPETIRKASLAEAETALGKQTKIRYLECGYDRNPVTNGQTDKVTTDREMDSTNA